VDRLFTFSQQAERATKISNSSIDGQIVATWSQIAGNINTRQWREFAYRAASNVSTHNALTTGCFRPSVMPRETHNFDNRLKELGLGVYFRVYVLGQSIATKKFLTKRTALEKLLESKLEATKIFGWLLNISSMWSELMLRSAFGERNSKSILNTRWDKKWAF